MGKILIRSKVQPSFPSDPVLGKKQNVYSQLNPWFVTGFVDGEGCFSINIIKDCKLNTGYQVQPSFSIGLHKKDKPLLQQIKTSLKVGLIFQQGSEAIRLSVQSIKELQAIINHFDKYSLNTDKCTNYKLLKQAFKHIVAREHLTHEGLKKIVAIKASMNQGLSEKLKLAFPDVVPVVRPLVENLQGKIIDPNWLAGFTSAEGCFRINIFKATTNIGEAVQLIFHISQHVRNELLMKDLINFFECGRVFRERIAFNFRVTKLDDITEKIIPFYKKYSIVGVRVLDFNDFCKIAEMIKDKKHLTKEGLEEIKKIKSGMNTGRKFTAESEDEKK